MRRNVIHGSRTGDTRRIAEAIAGALRERGELERVRSWRAVPADAAAPHLAPVGTTTGR